VGIDDQLLAAEASWLTTALDQVYSARPRNLPASARPRKLPASVRLAAANLLSAIEADGIPPPRVSVVPGSRVFRLEWRDDGRRELVVTVRDGRAFGWKTCDHPSGEVPSLYCDTVPGPHQVPVLRGLIEWLYPGTYRLTDAESLVPWITP
jgi:hypothetical protein